MSSEASGSSGEKHDFLPYQLDYIPENLRKRAKSELFEDEETRIHSLKLLRSMLKDETDLHWQDEDLFLLSFLRARKFEVKRAFQLMKTFYTVMGKHDELFSKFNFTAVQKTVDTNVTGFLPYRDREGSVILIINVVAWDFHANSMGDVMRALTCGLLHANLSPATHIAGFKVIVDFTGFTVKHLPHITPTYLWLFAEALQNCFPGRFRAVHIVNEDHIFSVIWTILKPFLSKKLKERFHFHGKNVKKLHKYFSPDILPVEYLGELPPFDNSEWRQMLEEKADYLKHVFSHGYKKYKTRQDSKKEKPVQESKKEKSSQDSKKEKPSQDSKNEKPVQDSKKEKLKT